MTASELAQLSVCERLIRFEAEHGRRETAQQRRAVRRGLDAHAAFYAEGLAEASRRKGKCFIATFALGPGPETDALRAWRDLFLRRSAAGPWIIAWYYRCGPLACALLGKSPRLTRCVAACLRFLARAAAAAVRRRVGGAHD